MTVEELVYKKDLYNSVVFIYDNHKGYYIYIGKAKDIPQCILERIADENTLWNIFISQDILIFCKKSS